MGQEPFEIFLGFIRQNVAMSAIFVGEDNPRRLKVEKMGAHQVQRALPVLAFAFRVRPGS
jgi:hypothetical protein